MYTIPPKKMLILNILDILRKYSDENHRLSAKEIGDLLEAEYSQKVDRKAIKRNLMNLIDFGYELEFTESKRTGKNGEVETIYTDWYFVREFTDSEIRLLIDSLLFSKTISYNQRKEIIEKLKGLSSSYFQSRVGHIRTLPMDLSANNQIFYTIDILDEAITLGLQVKFVYAEYGIDKKLYPRKNDDGTVKSYTVSPYQMVATNGRYYLICNRTGYPEVSNYRVDRIMNITITDQPILPLKNLEGYKNGLDLPKHMAEHVYMFSGKSVCCTFYARRYLISEVIDWFGESAQLREIDNDTVQVDVNVNEKAMYCWLIQYGEHTEVIAPQELRDKVAAAVLQIAEKYSAK